MRSGLNQRASFDASGTNWISPRVKTSPAIPQFAGISTPAYASAPRPRNSAVRSTFASGSCSMIQLDVAPKTFSTPLRTASHTPCTSKVAVSLRTAASRWSPKPLDVASAVTSW
jgi:hypothetical protein